MEPSYILWHFLCLPNQSSIFSHNHLSFSSIFIGKLKQILILKSQKQNTHQHLEEDQPAAQGQSRSQTWMTWLHLVLACLLLTLIKAGFGDVIYVVYLWCMYTCDQIRIVKTYKMIHSYFADKIIGYCWGGLSYDIKISNLKNEFIGWSDLSSL